jgi:hypothetical protein
MWDFMESRLLEQSTLTLERQLEDGTWEIVHLPIVDMVCHIPNGVYRGHNGSVTLRGGIYLRAPGYDEITFKDNSGSVISYKPKQHKSKTKEPFWCKKW